MNEPSDRLIDEAAERIARREPSDGLTTTVMAHVNSGAPSGLRPLVWSGIAVAAAIAGLVVVVSMNRVQPGVVVPSPLASTSVQPSQSQPVVQPALEPTQTGPLNGRASQSSVAQDELVALVEPIQIEPLSPPAIEPPPEIQIEPLKIEPLSAAND